jgi:hypothetical protein
MANLIRSAIGILGIATAIGVGCGGLKYPLCDNDESCNTDGHKGVCLAGKCVMCRDDSGCDKGQTCKEGACEAVVDFCDDSHKCPGDAPCTKNRCSEKVAAIKKDSVECDDDHLCKGAGETCQNNHCVAPIKGGPGCQDFPAPKFAYESPELSEESKKTLQRLAVCIMTGSLKGARVLLTGHCDARGEYEFNMGLGAERIATSSRGKLDAAGNDEAGYVNDRRVDIEVR